MVVDAPIRRKTDHTVQKVTDAEIQDKEKYWVFDHCKLLAKLLLYPLREAVEIEEGGDGDKVAHRPNSSNTRNDEKHERS